MPKISFLAAVVGALLVSTVSEAEEFQAPDFVPGTEFVFAKSRFGNADGEFTLKYKGKDEKGNYDFGEYTFSPSFERAFKGKEPRGTLPVKFPLAPGQSWEYSYTFTGPSCDDQTDKMKAQAGSSLEKATVNGASLDVIRIKHDGIWSSRCAGRDREGKLLVEYLYSPKLGMFVSAAQKVWSSNGRLNVDTGYSLISFGVPGRN